jgi:anti-sigma B factor antagonist
MMAASDNDFVRIENPADGVSVLVPTSDIDMSRSPELRSSIKGELKPGIDRMIIDLSEVQYMDSSGLATLVEAMRLAKKDSITLHLASMTEKVRAIFEIARLDAFFSIKDSRQEALDD